MNEEKKEKSSLVPRLRFPEFREAGTWEPKTIGDSCQSFSGGTPSTINKSFYGGEIPFIRSAEIDKDATELFLTNDGLEHSAAKMVEVGDILVALYGANSGDVALAKINGAINQAILCLRHETNNKFVYQYLAHRKEWIIATFIQGGQGNLSGEIVKAIRLCFPRPEEQQKIAECLSSLDDLIMAEIQKLDALKTHKKGLMQQLFPREDKTVPQLRFPEFREAPEWGKAMLQELVTTVSPPSKIQSSSYLPQGQFPIIDQSQVAICGWTNDESVVISESLPLIVFGDHTCVLKFVERPFAQGADGIKILNAKTTISAEFLFHSLNHCPLVMEDYKRHFSILKERIVCYPDIESGEQQKIADCLSSFDDLITAQSQKIDALKTHKKGLMQQLFPAPEEVQA